MATATSNSNSSISSAGNAFRILFDAISSLDDMSRVSTAFFTPRESQRGSVSQVTMIDATSQVTVTGSSPWVHSNTVSSETAVESQSSPAIGGVERPSGLNVDAEGKETRKQMLERRRKDCAVEEVDVALAPVIKIPVPYCFYPDQYKVFRKLFPRINVDSGLSYTHHDHPVAHTATLVGIRTIQGMLRPGEMALDLHGNPNGNERFNCFQSSRLKKRPHLPKPPILETLVEERTAADAVRRVTKWGEEYDENGHRRFYEMPISDIPPNNYDVFTSMHTLYYYTMYDVCRLLNKNPKARLHALVNYSKEQQGTLYGELSYSKSGGMTTQTSPNGERYTHPDIDQWFQTNSFRPHTDAFDGGIAWTSQHVGGPLYIITVTRCDYDLARTPRYDPPGAPTLKVERDRSFAGLVRIGGKDVRLRISNADLAAELRHFMTFRDRANPQVFQDLVVKARRCTSPDVVDGAKQFIVNDGDLQDHIVYAYLVDAPGELELMEGVKILRGDLLQPLAEALKLQGPDKATPYLAAMFQWLNGQGITEGALGLKKKGSRPLKKPNSGGLLPLART